MRPKLPVEIPETIKNPRTQCFIHISICKYMNIFRTLKTITLIFIFVSLSSSVLAARPDSDKIRFSKNEMTLREAFSEIERQTEYSFAYNEPQVNAAQKVRTDIRDRSLSTTLDYVLDQAGLQWQISKKKIMVSSAARGQADGSVDYSGTVTDSRGEPLPGASVVLGSSNTGVTTDMDGRFSISCNKGDRLTVMFLGFRNTEVTCGENTTLAVVMNEEQNLLDEVILVGYGKESRKFVTGAISNANLAQNENTANNNIGQALRGSVAGVQFIDSSRPGEDGSILIRGTRSISAGNQPLIVVDGIVFNGTLGDINPNDVKEMQVLKDAASASIYGSRAANGVILIETHRSGEAKPVIRFDMTAGLKDWSCTPKLLSPTKYLQKTLDYRYQNGQDAYIEDIQYYLQDAEAKNYLTGKTIDPYKVVSQQGWEQNYSLSVSGSSDHSKYYVSGMFSDEHGLIKNDNSRRVSLRTNIESRITGWMTVGINAMFSQRTRDGVTPDISSIHHLSPYAELYIDGDKSNLKLYPVDDSILTNPLFNCQVKSAENRYNNLFANVFAIIDFPFIKGLSYRMNYSPGFRWNHQYSFSSIYQKQGRNDTGAGTKTHTEHFDWVLENILDYSRTFAKKHYVGVTLMYGSNTYSSSSTTASSSNYFNDYLGWDSLQIGEVQKTSSSRSQNNGVSMMARFNYRFNDKYLATFTVRRDGSSVFGTRNKYSTFPSGALSWIISEEEFMKKAEWLDLLKLRVSCGQIGNQAISPYGTLSGSATTNYVFGLDSVVGIYASGMGNPDLKWETTTSTNVAADFSFFGNRFGGTVEFYDSYTTDLLIRQTLPNMTGFGQVWTNLGKTSNRGIELSLNSVNIERGKFSWNTNLSFTFNRNSIESLYGKDADGDGKEDDDIGNKWFIGYPVNVEYDYVFDGIYQVGDPMPAGYKPGYVRVWTEAGDPSKSAVATDKRVIGQKEPKIRWGLGNTFTYGNWSLYVFINAMHGWVGKFNRILPYNPGKSLNMLDVGYWTEQNKSQTRPSLVFDNPLNMRYYLKRDFVRIQDISLSYTLDNPKLEKIGMKGLKAFLTVKNAYTFTQWLGFDPETGTEPGAYPTARTYMMGLSFSF